jgi:hypothetical protein
VGFSLLEVRKPPQVIERCSLQGVNAKMPSVDNLHCYRSLWVGYDMDYFGNPSAPKLEEVTQKRRCEGFLQYKPGFSPEEHKQRLVKSEERKAQFAYTLLAAIVGCILTLLGLWAGRHFGLSK